MKIEIRSVSKCDSGCMLAEDVYSKTGLLILVRNTIINDYIKEKLLEMGINTVKVVEASSNLNSLKTDTSPDYIKTAKKDYKENVQGIKSVLNELASGKKLDIITVNDVTKSLYSNASGNFAIIECLNEVRSADEYTYSHCINVSLYAMLIGKWLNLSEENQKDLINAGILHDIGKSKLPIEILNKKGPLSPEEFDIIKKHPIYGYNIVKELPDINIDIKKAVLMHHEKEDGSGYPIGASGKNLNLYTKIISIADVYDALTSKRVYKRRLTPFETFKEFEKISYGTNSFDLKILMLFISNISSYYTGSKVKLKSGKTGEVVYVPPHRISNPIVKVNSEYIDLVNSSEDKIIEML